MAVETTTSSDRKEHGNGDRYTGMKRIGNQKPFPQTSSRVTPPLVSERFGFSRDRKRQYVASNCGVISANSVARTTASASRQHRNTSVKQAKRRLGGIYDKLRHILATRRRVVKTCRTYNWHHSCFAARVSS